jgi:hypothetical protein
VLGFIICLATTFEMILYRIKYVSYHCWQSLTVGFELGGPSGLIPFPFSEEEALKIHIQSQHLKPSTGVLKGMYLQDIKK